MSESSIWNELGNLYLKVEAYDEAINAFLKAIELNPDSHRSFCNLAYAYQQKGDFRKAVSLYRKNIPAIKSTMEKVLLWNRLGDVYRALKDFDNAIAAYKMADDMETEFAITGIDGKPNAESPLRDLRPPRPEQKAAGGTDHRDPAEAFRSLTNASSWPVRQQPPREIRTYHQPAEPARLPPGMTPYQGEADPEAARQPGEHPKKNATDLLVQEVEAKAPLMPVRALRPGAVEQPFQKPVALSSLQSPAGMTAVPAPAPELDEQKQRELEETQTKIDVYEKITGLNPSNDRAWDTLGKLYKSCRRYPEAISAFERAISVAPSREAYYYHLGLIYTVQKDLERAIQAFENVIRLNPDYAIAHGALAGIYRRMGRAEESDRHITIALPLMDNESAYNQACFHAICGNTDRAIELLKSALSNRDTTIEWIDSDPDLDLIRNDPRYQSLVRQDGNGARSSSCPLTAGPLDQGRELFANPQGNR